MATFIDRQAATGRLVQLAGVTTSAGAADVGKLPQLDAGGKLDASLMPSGIGAESQAAVAFEALAAGAWVNLFNNAGALNARNADGTVAGREANGYVIVAVASAAVATVLTDGSNTALTSLTPGARYFLSTTAGQGTLVPLTGSGQVHQPLGKASGATAVVFEHFEPITLA